MTGFDSFSHFKSSNGHDYRIFTQTDLARSKLTTRARYVLKRERPDGGGFRFHFNPLGNRGGAVANGGIQRWDSTVDRLGVFSNFSEQLGNFL